MQFLFNEVYLPHRGLLKHSLSSIYGLGIQRSTYLINTVGINDKLSTKKLSQYNYSIICSLVRKYMLVDSALHRLVILG